MTPAIPNAEDTLRRPAALDWVEELPEAVAVAEVEAVVEPVALDPELPSVAVPEPPVPLSATVVLTQLEEVPATIVTMSEY